ncbi:uncharacterized protein LOC100164028 isoform X1 [Acyrthosiphon pisum]|uniref:Uncharacterized protein n=2 Tax=Acyrthosiphon pisum TaxID=7029 RepID=A0A8R2BAK3_ACYPI|nr:uncharacterized protein LOC100164028 isoform X1 [Acyrthosiphon pisum]|eukprot:XP_008188891.1 PREDICTED: uncharacterized protein LOC100164028 isoform X1 [Acyrthosiphon pisum]
MNFKVTESAGSRHTAATVVGWGNVRAVVFVATVMFAAQFAAAQQVALKAGRLPRVYNALITTDQRLLPSQAEPIVTPVFRPLQFLYQWPEVRYAATPSYPSSRSDVEASGTDGGSSGHEVSRPVTAEVFDSSRPAGSMVVKNNRPADSTVVKNKRPVDATIVKNNRPADSSVPDVPPPPLPVTRGQDGAVKKRPEEYPPAPGGFAI